MSRRGRASTYVATDPSNNSRTNTYEVSVSGSGTTYDFDESGNLAEKADAVETWTYEWDAENRLTKVLKDTSTVATFKYDPFGRRIEHQSGSVTYSYTYTRGDILREIADDGQTSTNYVFVHGPMVDEVLAQEDLSSGSFSYYHSDRLRSVEQITNQDGTIVHSYRYDAWGNIEQGMNKRGFAFTGREWNPAEDLHYYRARYYDSSLGRFISEDPLGFDSGLNFYTYVFNNPALTGDPSGLDAFWPARFICRNDPSCRGWEQKYPPKPRTCADAQRKCKSECYIFHIGVRLFCDIICHYQLGYGALVCIPVCYTEAPVQWKCTEKCDLEYKKCYKQFGCRPYNQ